MNENIKNFMNEIDFLQLSRAKWENCGEKGDRDCKNDNKWREISGYYFIYSLYSYLFAAFYGNWLKWNRKLG